ncbi:MAG: RNHCP domain-containing protein [Firmicutes bacterium]|nr:RNHCP domain-containing protein [Bacillota bacterium]
MNDSKKFKMVDESFKCLNCGGHVESLGYTARDHCPYCLYSLHVDINPGDRLANCFGLLKPFGVEKFRDSYKILYVCLKCGYQHKNIMAIDDDFNKIIEISRREE